MVQFVKDSVKEFLGEATMDDLESFLGLGSGRSGLVKNDNYRIDLQNLTSSTPKFANLQIQINDNPKLKALRTIRRTTVNGNSSYKDSTATVAMLFVEFDQDYRPSGQVLKEAWEKIIDEYGTTPAAPYGMLRKDGKFSVEKPNYPAPKKSKGKKKQS